MHKGEMTMALVRWQPTRSLGFARDLDRLFDSFWGSNSSVGAPVADNGVERHWAPTVDVSENDEEIVVNAELPGVKTEDVKVTVEDDVLTIEGEKKQETGSGEESAHRLERSFGRFVRSFKLPAVDADRISASHSDGILKVTLPKPETAKPKVIAVNAN